MKAPCRGSIVNALKFLLTVLQHPKHPTKAVQSPIENLQETPPLLWISEGILILGTTSLDLIHPKHSTPNTCLTVPF